MTVQERRAVVRGQKDVFRYWIALLVFWSIVLFAHVLSSIYFLREVVRSPENWGQSPAAMAWLSFTGLAVSVTAIVGLIRLAGRWLVILFWANAFLVFLGPLLGIYLNPVVSITTWINDDTTIFAFLLSVIAAFLYQMVWSRVARPTMAPAPPGTVDTKTFRGREQTVVQNPGVRQAWDRVRITHLIACILLGLELIIFGGGSLLFIVYAYLASTAVSADIIPPEAFVTIVVPILAIFILTIIILHLIAFVGIVRLARWPLMLFRIISVVNFLFIAVSLSSFFLRAFYFFGLIIILPPVLYTSYILRKYREVIRQLPTAGSVSANPL